METNNGAACIARSSWLFNFPKLEMSCGTPFSSNLTATATSLQAAG
jgi:hypothetical protein